MSKDDRADPEYLRAVAATLRSALVDKKSGLITMRPSSRDALASDLDAAASRIALASLTVPEPDTDVVERVARAAYLEALTAGWNSGMARETMDADYANRAWLASDAAAAIAALRPQVEGEG